MRARGFHGTTRRAAEAILRDGFKQSRNPFDWLGDGVYFFQESRTRAQMWAEEHAKGGEWAVIEADIDLDSCMDLLERPWSELLAEAHDAVVAQHRRAGLRLPKQEGLAHGMDRLVINYAVGVLEDRGFHVASVRAAFQEGSPAFPGSALFSLSHVQIAVSDASAIDVLGTDYGGA